MNLGLASWMYHRPILLGMIGLLVIWINIYPTISRLSVGEGNSSRYLGWMKNIC